MQLTHHILAQHRIRALRSVTSSAPRTLRSARLITTAAMKASSSSHDDYFKFLSSRLRSISSPGRPLAHTAHPLPASPTPPLPPSATPLQASWNGKVIAESDKTEVVDNNHYFPPESIKKEFFEPSQTHTTCGWKGVASYYSVAVDGAVNKDAAWYYPEPKDAAKQIKGYVAFWKGVKVSP
jgi:uncharacterized protein (DUF427 family)